MKYQHLYYPETGFGGFTRHDGTVNFYTRLNALLEPEATVLDVGCGRGCQSQDPCPTRQKLRALRGKCRRVIGLDVDSAAATNPGIDEFRPIGPGPWPVDDGSVDMVLADMVIEHVEDPPRFFGECRRVLKSGGHFCFRTPNAWGYVGILSRLVPNRFHAGLASKAQDDRKAEDVFPTLYRCNTAGRLRRELDAAGFDACVFGYESEPSYLESSRFFYWLGTLHQKFAPEAFKLALFGFARKRTIGHHEPAR